MKQILSTIVILLTLLLPTVSWGGVDGKGIFCKLSEEKDIDGVIFSSLFPVITVILLANRAEIFKGYP